MCVAVISGRVNGLRALQCDPLPGFDVDAARKQPREVNDAPGLLESDLVAVVDGLVELAL
jgi:hypothetical protein